MRTLTIPSQDLTVMAGFITPQALDRLGFGCQQNVDRQKPKPSLLQNLG
jgi:hypothetical protein